MELVPPEVGPEQLAEVQGVVQLPGLEALVDRLAPVAAAVGALVEVIRVQPAVGAEHGEDALLVVARERAVQGAALHRLGEQLGDVPTLIGHDPAARNGLAAETVPVVEQGRAVVVGEDLQIDPELLAVAEDRPVVVGDAGRPHVRVQVVFAAEARPLPAVGFLQHVPAAGGEAAPASPAGGFEEGAAVAGPGQLPGGGHARDAGPQDHDVLAGPRAGREIGGGRMGRPAAREPQGLHGPVDGARPGHRADGLEELPLGHGRVHHVLSCRTFRNDEGPSGTPSMIAVREACRNQRMIDPPGAESSVRGGRGRAFGESSGNGGGWWVRRSSAASYVGT